MTMQEGSLPGMNSPRRKTWAVSLSSGKPIRLPRRPMHPGRFLETRFLLPSNITQDELAKALGISRRRVNELVRGKRGVSPDTALRLALCFGLDAEFWLRLQTAWDAHQAWLKLDGNSQQEE